MRRKKGEAKRRRQRRITLSKIGKGLAFLNPKFISPLFERACNPGESDELGRLIREALYPDEESLAGAESSRGSDSV
jgi:hypothetical protein